MTDFLEQLLMWLEEQKDALNSLIADKSSNPAFKESARQQRDVFLEVIAYIKLNSGGELK